MDNPYRRELSIAFAALQGAARLSQSIVSSADKGAISKSDLSPVTIADFAVQSLLIATCKAAFPDDSFVGEEDASDLRANPVLLDRVWDLLQDVKSFQEEAGFAVPDTKAQLCDLVDQAGSSSPASGRTWVFDPIDGTKTFIRGQLYAINVALLVDGKQAVSAVACPNMPINATAPLNNPDIDPSGEGCIVYAVKGHGAWVLPLAGNAEIIQHRQLPHVSSSTGPGHDLRFITSVVMADSALDGVHEAVAQRLGAAYPGCDLLPWVLRWAALAMGLGNTTVWVYNRRDRYGKVWDHAGAMLLFEETGGKITDVHGKHIDLVTGRKLSANFGFVAASESLHTRVLAAVQEVLREAGREDLLR
ncbi:3'(2'),5'-bisphosphate nucleotidase [Purpureocillium takamizusanense]|uniref:3'(2'),5'-bisphosphate nucleotidase n=1 Tax=Purpureocillium takamizusanense TaxID=2060973 RepID=A0A9Q8VF31_9HYPO|nr:3'(2'),5'-bisphosphate nucleotidase [Purpureocillium takamizusanense]UNI24575.1 3'(2'),5'-bisphosphate nucleotidase [Purpureocillium takamizusanense]